MDGRDTERVIYSPEEFREYWASDSGSQYRISSADPHPNPEGHKILGEKLYNRLEEDFRSE
ncbi:MAG: hypothetical protein ABEJ69_01785 [Candidatus Nanohaloarchaea archaeon]